VNERAAIGGWGAANVNVFNIENGRIGDYNRPDDGTNCAGAASYDPVANPFGTRCTFQDFMPSVLGRRAQDGYANLVFDNVGVQYGLSALNAGTLSAEKFVDVNKNAGGFDVNGRWQPARSAITPEVAALLHRTGNVTYGRNLGLVPEIATRSTNNNDYHYPFRTYVQRARLTATNGHADNHVFWIAAPSSQSSLRAMDRWLEAAMADTSDRSWREKIVANKPGDIVNACWIGGVMTTDMAACDTTYPYFREPRTVAGDAVTTYVMKCQLKPLVATDYAVTFTPQQWADLQAAFPDGVCDFSKPGVGFQPTVAWLDYSAGAGGTPIGDEPAVNTPPDVTCTSVTVAASQSCTASASVNGGVSDPNGDAVTVVEAPSGPFGLGITQVTLTATDARGFARMCKANVTVVDSTGPAIASASASPSTLWPANHKMVPVSIDAAVSDNCSAKSSCRVVGITANEAIDAADAQVTGPMSVSLRADRAGSGDGRVYTVTVECKDDAGNASRKDVAVNVPHDQGKSQ
jgi:hypothetical protein